MIRIVQRRVGSYTLTAAATDSEGTAVDISGTATLTIYDGGDTAVVSAVTPTIDGNGDLVYAASIDDIENLDTYEAVWGGTAGGVSYEWLTRFEICGGHLFEVSDLRAYDSSLTLADYPAATVQQARLWAEQRLEQQKAAGVAFVPRGAREAFVIRSSERLYLSHPQVREVYSISIDGTALTATELAEVTIDGSQLIRDDDWEEDTVVTVHYAHGLDEPPGPVVQAAMILAREYLIRSNLSSRAISESTDVGFLRLSVPGTGGKTGIPEVDAVIADMRETYRPAVYVG